MTAITTENLLDADFRARLERLDVLSRKVLAGKLKGERRSKRRGQSVEFADFRNYVVGDDLRFIDWNLYARLDRLFLKLFLEEEDLALHVLIDTSRSADYGTPNKLAYMKRVAAALGYIGAGELQPGDDQCHFYRRRRDHRRAKRENPSAADTGVRQQIGSD